MKSRDAVETVGLSALIISSIVAGAAADRRRLDRDVGDRGRRAACSVLHQGGLRLDRDDARAEPAERGDAVADMGADIEHQIARAARSRA